MVNSLGAQLKKEISKATPKIEDQSVVRFAVTATNGRTYSYAGLFTNNRWYFTGEGSLWPRSLSHEEFILQVSKRKEEIFFLEAAEEYSSVLDGWNFG